MLNGTGVLLVPRDVPDVPFACERQRLTLCQRLSLSALCRADRLDPAFYHRSKFADADLDLLRLRPSGHHFCP